MKKWGSQQQQKKHLKMGLQHKIPKYGKKTINKKERPNKTNN